MVVKSAVMEGETQCFPVSGRGAITRKREELPLEWRVGGW